MIGPVVFDMTGVNHQSLSNEEKTAFGKHDVVGAAPIYEFGGEDEAKLTIEGKLLPRHLGGLDGLEALKAMRATGVAWMAVRGDGFPLGWHLIEKIKDKHGELDFNGVGQEVEFTVELLRAGAPNATTYLSLFNQIAGG
ncbi:phage tail protein [Terrarubrum flagellatum]|uniref:phage tail protein n=1 Tax=Terrirubrum flagellatum TaxID=2895980 RepID=UPI003145052C